MRYDDICIEMSLVHHQGIEWKHVCEEYEQQHCREEQQLLAMCNESSSSSSSKITHTDTCLLSMLLDVLVYSVAKVAVTPVVLSMIRIASCSDYICATGNPNARQRILQSIDECLESVPAVMLSEGVSRIICSCIIQSRSSAAGALEVAKWLILRRPSLSPDLCALVVNIALELAPGSTAAAASRGDRFKSITSLAGAVPVCPISQTAIHVSGSRRDTSARIIHLAEVSGSRGGSCDENKEMTSCMLVHRKFTARRHNRKNEIKMDEAALFNEVLAMFNATVLSSKGEFEVTQTFHAIISIACARPSSGLTKACAISFAAKGKALGYSTLFQRIWGAYSN